MFHRVKSEGQARPSGDTAKTQKTEGVNQAEKTETIKPEPGIRMAQNAALNAAQGAPANNAANIARQSYIQKQAQYVSSIAPAQAKPVAPAPAAASVEKTAAVSEQAKEAPTSSTNQAETTNEKDEKTMSQSNTTPASETTQAQPRAAQPAGYNANSSYGGYAAKPSTGNESRLTIGRGITLSGEIENCAHLLVEGTVEAALKGASVLEISESGTFYGSVEINEAEIAGRFEGDLTAYDRLVIRSTGVITGAVSYKEIEVEPGARIEGRMSPLPAQAAETNKTREVRASESASYQAANTDGQDLFNEKKTAAAE